MKRGLMHVEKKPKRLRGTDPDVIAELKNLSIQNNGLLRAEDVVEAARDESSLLHSKFEWDDSEAGIKYRLIQARYMISVSVQYIPTPAGKSFPTKVFVSLSTDRYGQGNSSAGYRQLVDVLSDNDLKQQLLQDSLEQMNHFQDKYKTLTELKDVFKAIENTRRRIAPVVQPKQ